jgi:hypothetical protein
LSVIGNLRELPNATVMDTVASPRRIAVHDFYPRLQRTGGGQPWIGMPFCFTSQLHRKAVATELAALRRLAEARKRPAERPNKNGPARLAEASKTSPFKPPQAPAAKAQQQRSPSGIVVRRNID